jgi:hypothetical protein
MAHAERRKRYSIPDLRRKMSWKPVWNKLFVTDFCVNTSKDTKISFFRGLCLFYTEHLAEQCFKSKAISITDRVGPYVCIMWGKNIIYILKKRKAIPITGCGGP